MTGLQAAPESAGRNFLLSAVYSGLGENDKARDARLALQADFDASQRAQDRRPRRREGLDPCRTHRYAECAALLQARKQLSPSDLLLLGKTQFTLRRYEPAADTLAGVLAISKENVEATYWLARSYDALGAECFDQLEASFPQSWRAHQLRGEGEALRGALNDAAREFQLALDLRPDEAELHEALGEPYLSKNSYPQAQSELDKALALDSTRTHALYLLGRLYVRKRETGKAVPYLQRALRLQADLTEASSLLGTAYVRLGRYADAVPALKKAASSDFYGNIHFQLSLAYRRPGKVELADEALSRSEELRRSSAARHQNMVIGGAEVE